ncbi:HAMP domain-containing histidine kinase [Clostridium sp. MSJ-11]|uniref:histidine kinase n=1 Tax=Clostridium mobile TaxID=2841512 RepID=A0ABS6EFB5_9CLOT|nr:HAMP domain-containing sensor histidine kinase [Clostridium mobile]MBU5483906.1 HAMP domain-containing histidine kinase [Clostridium mobile]
MDFIRDRINRFLVSGILILIIFLWSSGFFILSQNVNSMKEIILNNDAKIAGYLLEQGMSPADVAKVVTSQKNSAQIENGKKLLKSIGYKTDIKNAYLPSIKEFNKNNKHNLLYFLTIFSIMILALIIAYLNMQKNSIISAANIIHKYIEGDFSVRLDSEKEGIFSQFLGSINEMATMLYTHLEKEKQRKEFLKEMISDISHQLKTPIAALKMYNEIIIDEYDNPNTIKKFTAKSNNSIERMELLVLNLLKMAKLETGIIHLEKRKDNVLYIIQDAIEPLETRAENEHKKISYNGDITISLTCDRDWMIEAIGNIIKNALDHTTVENTISVSCRETPIFIEIKIVDNGKGIHPEDIPNIFKRFYRSKYSKNRDGAGLGLSLAKSIIEANGGIITVNSKLNVGTEFTLTFIKLTNK